MKTMRTMSQNGTFVLVVEWLGAGLCPLGPPDASDGLPNGVSHVHGPASPIYPTKGTPCARLQPQRWRDARGAY
jgi:hypothetical protein